MADQKIVTETALSAFASDVKGELINKIGYDELPTISDNEPYNFRPSANGKDIGDRETDKIIGGTVAFNQLVSINKIKATETVNGVTKTNNNDGTVTLSNTATADFSSALTQSISAIKNHVYLLKLNGSISFYTGYPAYGNNVIKWNSDNTSFSVYGTFQNGVTYNETVSVVAIDLTQMFGSTIADYIYNLEQGTPGAGVAWFKKLFPKPYYAYNAGELMSVKTSAHVMIGFNQWDEQWEVGGINSTTGQNDDTISNRIRTKNYVPLMPNATYYKKCPTVSQGAPVWHFYYDANKNFIGIVNAGTNQTFTPPTNAYYMRFYCEPAYGTTYNHDICINISCPDNGTYEPYEVNTYPLDSDLELRGIPKLDANNQLYYDGDEYESDGNVKRRYGIVDLGTLSWNRTTSYDNPVLYANLSLKAVKNIDMLCLPFVYGGNFNGAQTFAQTVADKTIANCPLNNQIFVRADAYSDAATFKTAMNGVYLVYELATPTTEQADAYQNPQIVNDFGTEEYVDTRDVAIPVGHETEYVKNMDKLLLPATPSADGTYTLKCTVSGGTPTLSWVADT